MPEVWYSEVALAVTRGSFSVVTVGSLDYSQRNTRADKAVHTTHASASAPMSARCADQASPFQMPRISDTAYVIGSRRAIVCITGGSAATGTNNPDNPSIGYRMIAPIGCAKRAVGTMLAITNPIDKMLAVLITSATMNENTGTCALSG